MPSSLPVRFGWLLLLCVMLVGCGKSEPDPAAPAPATTPTATTTVAPSPTVTPQTNTPAPVVTTPPVTAPKVSQPTPTPPQTVATPKPVAKPWTPTKPVAPPKPSTPQPLVCLTYNVLADRLETDKRTAALFKIMKEQRPDVIALQEADEWFLRLLTAENWYYDSYHGTPLASPYRAPGGQFIASKYPIRKAQFHDQRGAQHRTVLVAEIDAPGGPVTVATIHLESPLEDVHTRSKQLEQIFRLVADAETAIVLGDFNFGDAAPEESNIPADYVDLWKVLHPQEPGLTWDIEKSQLAARSSFPGETSRRIDRILLKSKTYVPESVKIVGDTPLRIDRTLFPSDHFGLVGTIKPK